VTAGEAQIRKHRIEPIGLGSDEIDVQRREVGRGRQHDRSAARDDQRVDARAAGLSDEVCVVVVCDRGVVMPWPPETPSP
jgi:hypothetical protein